MKNLPVFLIRLSGAFAGFLGGGILGILVLITAMMITGSDFGLDSVRPGGLAGAIVGAVVGFFSPGRALKVLGKTT